MLRSSNSELFRSTAADHPVSFSKAIDAVGKMDPEFGVADVSLKDGVYLLSSADGSGHTYFVDAGTGAVNGTTTFTTASSAFLENLHDCALTCEEYAGYLPWLAAPSAVAGFRPSAI